MAKNLVTLLSFIENTGMLTPFGNRRSVKSVLKTILTLSSELVGISELKPRESTMTEVMSQAEPEQKFVENPFGTVTNKRVIYNRAKGWFSGGSREDIPLQHVTSVRMETSRSLLGGILLLLIGLGMLASPEGGIVFLGILLAIVGVLILWGSPAVIVNTAGRDMNAAKGLPWQRGAANEFVETLRQQLFKS